MQIKKNYVDFGTLTLGRVVEGKQDIERVGVLGCKVPALPLAISVALIECMVAANDAGTRRSDKGDLKHQGRRMAEALGRDTDRQFSSGWLAATKHKLMDATGQSLRPVIPRAKTKADSSKLGQPGAPIGRRYLKESRGGNLVSVV